MESESDPLTRRVVDVFEKEPLKGNSEVHLHTPTKFGDDRSKDLGGDREQTDRQTNRQTDKRCSIYSMIYMCHGALPVVLLTSGICTAGWAACLCMQPFPYTFCMIQMVAWQFADRFPFCVIYEAYCTAHLIVHLLLSDLHSRNFLELFIRYSRT